MSMSIAELGLKIDATPLDAFNSKIDATIIKAGKLQDALSSFNMSSTVIQSIEAIDKSLERTSLAMNAKFASLGAQRVAQDAKENADILANQTSNSAKIDALMNRYIERSADIAARKLQIEQRNTDAITAMYRKMFDDITRSEAISRATFSGFGVSSSADNRPITSNNSFANASGLSQQTSATQALSSATVALGQSVQQTRSHYDELHRILGKTHDMLIRMAAYRGINLVFGAPGAILDVNIRMESLRVQLEGITGSANQAKAVFKELLALDIKTPFDIEGLAKTWIRLKNYGLEPTVEVMKSLTDGVARLGGGTDILNRVSLQLGQAWAKNKLQLQDMKPMMDAGIPVLSILAEKMHTNAGAILEMSHAGTIGHKEMELLLKGIEEWAPNASLRAMDTLKGSISNITTSWIQFQDALLNTKGESNVKDFFNTLSTALFYWTAKLKENENVTSSWAKQQKEVNELIAAKKALDEHPILAKASALGLIPWDFGASSLKLLAGVSDAQIKVAQSNLEMAKTEGLAKIAIEQKSLSVKKDLELAEQSEKAINAQVAALESLERVNKAIADAENARIDAKVHTVGIISGLTVKQYEDEYKANQDSFKNLEMGQKVYLDKQMQLITAIRDAKLKAIDDESALIKTKTNQQVDDVSKAIEVIHAIESGNGRPGQEVNRKNVNIDSWTLGAGQAKISTLRDPGVKGILPYGDMESIDKIKGNYDALVEYVKTHQAELTAWSDKYFTQLVVKYGSVMGALKQYGEGTEAYNKKFISMYNDNIGFTQKQIALDQTQMNNELRKKGIIEESLASQSKLTQQLTQDIDNQVKALKSKYETPNEKANTEIERLNKLRAIYDESVLPMKLYNQALSDIEATRVKDNQAIADSLNNHKELDSILKNLNKETLNAGKSDRELYLNSAQDSIVEAAKRDGKAVTDLQVQMNKVSKTYDNMITAKQTADLVKTIKDGFSQGFKDVLSGAKNFGDAFKSILDGAINKIIDNSLQNLMTGFEKVFDGVKGGWMQVAGSFITLAASAITSLFSQKTPTRVSTPAESYTNSTVVGTGAMAISDNFGRDFGLEYQTQTIIRFNKNLDALSSGLITGIKNGIEQFGTSLAKLPVINTVIDFMKPITNIISGVYNSISDLVSKGFSSIAAIGSETSSLITAADYEAANLAASVGEPSGLMEGATSSIMKTAGSIVAVVSAIYTTFNYFSGLGDMIKRGNVVEMISSTGVMIGAVMMAASAVMMTIPIVGWIGAAITVISSALGLFGKQRIPNVWMNTYNPDQSGAKLIDYSYASNVAVTGNKSATLAAYTPFGSTAISTHEMSLSTQEMVNAFGDLLKTVKVVDINLYNTVMRIDAAMGQAGKSMDYYNGVLVGSNRIATKQDISGLNTGDMLSTRYDWIVNQLAASGSVVGQYINAWFDVITNKFITVSQSNSMFVLGVINSLANNIDSFMQFPLSLVNLIGKSVKSTSAGGTPDSVMAEISGVFNTYQMVKNGLTVLGLGGEQNAVNEGIIRFLSTINAIGYSVNDAGINLLAYAIAIQKTGNIGVDALTLLNNANSRLIYLKSQGMDNTQITAYIGSFGLMANMFAEAKVIFTENDLNVAAQNIHKLSQASVDVAKNTVNLAIAQANLTNVTRESAIATLVKNKTLDAATVAESEYGVSIQKVTKDMLDGMSFIQQIGFTSGKSLGEIGISADTWQKAAGNIVNVFGDLTTAMSTWDNITKTFLSSSDYAQYNLDTINRSLKNMADVNPDLGKWFTPESIAAQLKSGESMANYITLLSMGDGELAKSSFSYIDLLGKKIAAEKNLQDAMNSIMQTYNDMTAWLNKDKRGDTSGTSDLARNLQYWTQLGDLYNKVSAGDTSSVTPLLSLVDEYKGFLQKFNPANFSQISELLRQSIENLQVQVGTNSGMVLPSHANGLDFVPYDGYIAKLHKGEKVLTSSESRNLKQKDDSAIVDMLIELIKTEREGFKQVINELKQANKNTSDMKASARRRELSA